MRHQMSMVVLRKAHTMVHFSMWILLLAFSVKVADSNHIPRVRLTEKDVLMRRCALSGNNIRTELLQGPHEGSLYVGGHGKIFYVDFTTSNQYIKEVDFPLLVGKSNQCTAASKNCEHDITILHNFNDSLLFVCGTNGISTDCCYMKKEPFGMCSDVIAAEGIAPYSVTERAPSLYIGPALYTAANSNRNGNSVAIRRFFHNRIWSDDSKKEQRYVSMVYSGPRESYNDRVYAFLVEKNSDEHPEAAPWMSWVSQVCTADMGGTKSILQNSWTSRLSARLYCGNHEKKLYFNQLVDVAVLKADQWNASRVYALFNNSWGMSAVCVYTMAEIDHVFTTSQFRGNTGSLPSPRPGTCVKDSRTLPQNVLRFTMDHSEMESGVWPRNNRGPLMVSHRYYRHIQVDAVKGRNDKQYNVLFLSLESGGVHKVLEQDSGAFIIAELQPLENGTHIQNMLLQSSKKKLYVASSSEVVEVDLQSCEIYGDECVGCIQARDPYCSWNGNQCAATASSTIQDVEHGDHTVCVRDIAVRKRTSERNATKILPSSKYYLKCPMFSSLAKYTWRHGSTIQECVLMERDCLLLINSMSPEKDGIYQCVASEGGYERTVAEYDLQTESKARGLVPSPLASACLLLLLTLLN